MNRVIISPYPYQSNVKAYVDEILKGSHISLSEAIRRINSQYPESATTPQNMTNKITRGSLRLWELAQLATVCGFDLELRKQTFNKDNTLEDEREQQLKLIESGYGWLESDNLGTVFFYGVDWQEAMAVYRAVTFKTPFEEIAYLASLEKEYSVKIESVKK